MCADDAKKHYIYPTKCTGDYVGQYINSLTLAQVKSLDCDLQLEEHPQQESMPIPSWKGDTTGNAAC